MKATACRLDLNYRDFPQIVFNPLLERNAFMRKLEIHCAIITNVLVALWTGIARTNTVGPKNYLLLTVRAGLGSRLELLSLAENLMGVEWNTALQTLRFGKSGTFRVVD
ncbi:MAG TPA: hypothetical protein VFA65_24250 [Bryobacteraceae bacterium]|nr:hypothetical protein [Bryobacteraceae bacterium]